MDLRDLLSVLRARWAVIVSATLLGGVFALTLSLLATPVYQSRIQFYVTVAAGDNAAAAYQGSLGAQQRVQSYAELVSSSEVARQVVSATQLDINPETVAANSSASADANTVLLNVGFTDPDPRLALVVAEGYGEILPGVVNRLETPDGGGPALAKLTVVDPPLLPAEPVSPNTEQNVAIGVSLGLLAGVGMALLISVLDRRVRTEQEVEAISGAPVVGAIPFRRNEDRESGAEHLVPFREGHSPAAEAFRRLRTNLQFLNVDNPPKVLVITSSVPTEGKSETAANLSLALAEAGYKVLLVEADLRRPRVVNYLSMPDKVGLTNVLSGQADFPNVVQETRYEGVDLLACGPLPPNPSELLASGVTAQLVSDLRDRYDYIVIDSPPLLPVTDGALLSGLADGALLVVRMDRTTSDQVKRAVDNLGKADATLLGVVAVANKTTKRNSSAYYESYYASQQK